MNAARTVLLLLAFAEVFAAGAFANEGAWKSSFLQIGTAGVTLFVCAYLPETVRAVRDLFTTEEEDR